MFNLITENSEERQGFILTLDEIAREGARRMLEQALQAEVSDYIDRYADLKDERGKRVVVRNGKAQPRHVTMGSGTVQVASPRVNDRRLGEKFSSKILPPYLRKSAKVENLLPLLYLKGLSSSDFQSALKDILGEEATGLSPSAIVALKKSWEKEYSMWKKRVLTKSYVYLWADGIHVKIRLGEDRKLCLLVLIGVTEDGKKSCFRYQRRLPRK